MSVKLRLPHRTGNPWAVCYRYRRYGGLLRTEVFFRALKGRLPGDRKPEGVSGDCPFRVHNTSSPRSRPETYSNRCDSLVHDAIPASVSALLQVVISQRPLCVHWLILCTAFSVQGNGARENKEKSATDTVHPSDAISFPDPDRLFPQGGIAQHHRHVD